MRKNGYKLQSVAREALVLGLVILSFVAPAAAMDISIQRLPNGYHAVFASGLIVAGDAERLRSALQSADRNNFGYKNIALNSGGGLVNEAFAMAAERRLHVAS
jgi:membrane-bound ClpP family serine protease